MFLLVIVVDACSHKQIQSPCSEGCLVLEYIRYKIIFIYSSVHTRESLYIKTSNFQREKNNLITNKRKFVPSHVFVTSSF